MDTFPFSLKRISDGVDTCPFSPNESGDGMGACPSSLKDNGDGMANSIVCIGISITRRFLKDFPAICKELEFLLRLLKKRDLY